MILIRDCRAKFAYHTNINKNAGPASGDLTSFQLLMLVSAAQVRYHLPAFHEIIDRAIDAQGRCQGNGRAAGSNCVLNQRDSNGSIHAHSAGFSTTAFNSALMSSLQGSALPASTTGLESDCTSANCHQGLMSWDASVTTGGGFDGTAVFASASLEISVAPEKIPTLSVAASNVGLGSVRQQQLKKEI